MIVDVHTDASGRHTVDLAPDGSTVCAVTINGTIVETVDSLRDGFGVLRLNDVRVGCEYFAGCNNQAVTAVNNPAVGVVATCDRCTRLDADNEIVGG